MLRPAFAVVRAGRAVRPAGDFDQGIHASINATRLKKGMLVKIDQDLFRVLELPACHARNLRGFVRIKFRNIRSGNLSDQKLAF